MKRLIFGICFIAIFSIIMANAHAKKTFEKKTKDNEVYTKEMVQVELTDTSPKLTTYTLNSLYTRRQVLITQIVNKQVELVILDTLILNIESEADKVILKTPE